MATPGSTAADQLKRLPAFFSPSTRSRPKNGGGDEGTVKESSRGWDGRVRGEERIKEGPPQCPTKDARARTRAAWRMRRKGEGLCGKRETYRHCEQRICEVSSG